VAGVSSPLLFASYLIRLRCDHDAVSAAFIHAVFNSTRIRLSLLRSATTSAGNYNINTESLRALTIPLPPLPEQRRIADTIAALSVTCDVHEYDFWQKRYLRENLASDLLSGRVRVAA
jgi:type I restriction enzyme S subunit